MNERDGGNVDGLRALRRRGWGGVGGRRGEGWVEMGGGVGGIMGGGVLGRRGSSRDRGWGGGTGERRGKG